MERLSPIVKAVLLIWMIATPALFFLVALPSAGPIANTMPDFFLTVHDFLCRFFCGPQS